LADTLRLATASYILTNANPDALVWLALAHTGNRQKTQIKSAQLVLLWCCCGAVVVLLWCCCGAGAQDCMGAPMAWVPRISAEACGSCRKAASRHSHEGDVQARDAKGGQCGAQQPALHPLQHHHCSRALHSGAMRRGEMCV